MIATPTDTDRRLAMLARVERGELDQSAAAKEFGLTPGVWGLWQARQAKAAGGGKAKPAARKKAVHMAVRSPWRQSKQQPETNSIEPGDEHANR